jgi:hypothetical protein
MREFLYHKLIQFNEAFVEEFQDKMTGLLPVFNRPDFIDATIWGSTDKGRWLATLNECRFYENNGTIHIVGWERDTNWFENYCKIYERSITDNIVTLSTPVDSETSNLIIQNRYIAGLSESRAHYIKLQTPNQSYGLTMMLSSLLKPIVNSERNDEIWKYINEVRWILETCKSLDIAFPEVISTNTRLQDADSFFYTVLPKFVLDLESSINWHLAYLDTKFLINMPGEHKQRNKQYAREQWLPLIN